MKRFTIIELLVVISIIAILASLLLPGLNKARKTSKILLSLGNMKQLNYGVFMYLEDNNGRFPPGRSPVNYGWDDYISSYIGVHLTEAEKTAANPSYRGSFKIWQCPLDDVIRNINNRVTRSYTSNSYTTLGSKRIFDYNNPRYIHELPDPSKTFTIVEQAKSYNTVGSGSNVIIKDDTNLMEATIGVMKSGNVQYDANHHNNGFKNPVINADGNGKIMYMPTTTADNNYLWSSKVY